LTDIQHILNGCKNKDILCQEKLYKLFYPALFNLCKLFFDDKHEALSALNNGMLKVYNNIEKYNDQQGTLFNWMYTIIRNEALSYLTTKKKVFINVELQENVEAVWNGKEFKNLDIKDMSYCLEQLPLATRNVCRLCYLDGFSINDIANILGISAGTIKWHLSESRKKLKPILEKHYTT
jgi:RNA polymerase sigma factor (sigma-70 family)